MCSTPFGITEGVTQRAWAIDQGSAIVLNAFRHHGGRHSWERSDKLHDLECSTPFGITEGVTLSIVVPEALSSYVLNAFRHHGGRHLPSRFTLT